MNYFGNNFKISIYGASHDEKMGVIIQGVKPGVKLDLNLIKEDLNKRRPKGLGETSRIEEDLFEVVTPLNNGLTTGDKIEIVLYNKNIKKSDYDNFVDHPRPGHADYVSRVKYGTTFSGGGIFSGRLTSLLVIAGAIAKMVLPFEFSHQIKQIGQNTDFIQLDSYLEKIKDDNDSVGGIIEVTVQKMIPGLGDPFFNKLDARIAYLLFNIPAVKGVFFGEDVLVNGSEYNDLIINVQGQTKTNNAGGINGGISNGNDLKVSVFFRPPSSIGKTQNTFNFKSKTIEPLTIKGRHDATFIKRAGIILENAIAIVLADYYLSR